MLKGYFEQIQKPTATMPMRVFMGKCESRSTSPVVGRLIPAEQMNSLSGNEAFLAVIRNSKDADISYDTRIVGVVDISDAGREAASPLCPTIKLPSLPEDCRGRIALLDTVSETLFVSPDIYTVNKYTRQLTSKDERHHELDLTLPDGKRIKIIKRADKASKINSKGQGFLFCPPKAMGDMSEDSLYESYRDAAERAMGLPVTVLAPADEQLSDRLKAILRGAVFGDLSLLFCGILTETELLCTLESFCRAFCELETEGREFNGYLSRGLLVDTPYLFSCSSELGSVDFIAYDAERLARLMSGDRKKVPKELLGRLGEDICRKANKHRELAHSAILGSHSATPELCQRLMESGITKYFVPEDMTETVAEIFYRLINE